MIILALFGLNLKNLMPWRFFPLNDWLVVIAVLSRLLFLFRVMWFIVAGCGEYVLTALPYCGFTK